VCADTIPRDGQGGCDGHLRLALSVEAPDLALFAGAEAGAVVQDGVGPFGVFVAGGDALAEALPFTGGLGDGVEVAAVGQGAVGFWLQVMEAAIAQELRT